MEDSVSYCGVIESVDGHNVLVRVSRGASCAGCSVEAACIRAGGGDHLIEVTDFSGEWHKGEAVMLEGRDHMGLKAVVIAFVIPVLFIAGFVIAGAALGWREDMSALCGLLSLFPYYIVLYLLRGALKKEFVFTLKKIDI
ncbi:MAG: SoxR reducing system RseC family protein [Tannerellaceae bacterium]|nr:SoxR reducing system RseC family protein [Tannerellaceae bacterium]